jgi:hypothetical protein
MTPEQLKGALLFIDAIDADLKVNKTHHKEKIGLKLKLANAIKSKDAEKAKEIIRRYHNLTRA